MQHFMAAGEAVRRVHDNSQQTLQACFFPCDFLACAVAECHVYKHSQYPFCSLSFSIQAAFSLLGSLLAIYLLFVLPSKRAHSDPEDLRQPLVTPVSPGGTHTSDPMSDLTVPKLLKVTGLVAVAGFVAGVVGIGGGMLMGPMLLDLRVHPQVGRGERVWEGEGGGFKGAEGRGKSRGGEGKKENSRGGEGREGGGARGKGGKERRQGRGGRRRPGQSMGKGKKWEGRRGKGRGKGKRGEDRGNVRKLDGRVKERRGKGKVKERGGMKGGGEGGKGRGS